ncbi:MAG: energy transducer TonB [Candidatus Abyssobacteria bacterium SURF_5]|jgi:protein TonB|uniref:Energy transducer TonB n=1 Tax=Abyssobacteria bacterium (strain SURF_5) TaxID=2093360 RepID=A0A3A4NGG9_ABYX5|nr:MAG: energy transducer TonB [Candidatus Abyssubacteria bacterium SURF_5]
MRDNSLVASLILAGLIHFALLFCKLPAAQPLPANLIPAVQVALVAAPARLPVSDTAPTPAEKKKYQPVIHAKTPPAPLKKPPQEKTRSAPMQKPVPVKMPVPDVMPLKQEVVEVKPPEQESPQEELEAPQQPEAFAPAIESPEENAGSAAIASFPFEHEGNDTAGAFRDGQGSTVPEQGLFDAMPSYAYNPKPHYPRSARSAGQEGTAILRVEVLSSGKVGRIEVEKSSGYDLLDREAVRAIQLWRFAPARRGTRPVTAWVRVPIEFSLRD